MVSEAEIVAQVVIRAFGELGNVSDLLERALDESGL